MKKFVRYLLMVIATILLVVIGYVSYVFLSYSRAEDNLPLTVTGQGTEEILPNNPYIIATYNIGYAAYSPDYSFFMDGGKYSRGFSEAAIKENLTGIIDTTKEINPDFAFFQEVDEQATRSYGVNQVDALERSFADYSSIYGENYRSAYLFYPVTEPIGQSKSGLVTISKGKITESTRYSLPIETNFNKFFDLDRAFTVSDVPVANGRTLTLINVHLSAYTKDPKIQKAQIKKLSEAMSRSYQAGNYVIVGGDYNHALLEDSETVFKNSEQSFSWNQPFPKDELPEGFSIPETGLAEAAIPSVRNLDEDYQKGRTFVTLIDGFIVSNNISVKEISVLDKGFQYSDHNPVQLTFELTEGSAK
ncbi:hydrolase [Enterococcus sp. JM4C]|uniref:endonuclease/exonuclease/phosphatase family protein n=1 Tax=Candidatus Enterococcus huntleyi TaxID=1857217 RepID=UPI00137B8F8E|nr:hydrolase [Enterococcus sp. JM4C]KAF1295654.1 hydrolase [Enterococcus sp. JM4C]